MNRVSDAAGTHRSRLAAELDAQHRARRPRALLALQRPDGHWVFELEADATIPAEYVLLRHYLAEPVDAALEAKIAVYLRRIQGEHGGWPLFHDGDFDMSASVKAYFALKMIGDSIDAPHMARAREAIRSRGGARALERVHAADAGAVRLHSLARRAGHAGRDHAAAEVVSVPSRQDFLLEPHRHRAAAGAAGAQAEGAQPQGRAPSTSCSSSRRRRIGPAPKAPQQKASWFWFFRGVDVVLRAAEPWFPKRSRQRAIDRAVAWVTERLNGEDGLGAIFPAMANSVMMFDVLGYPEDHPQRAIARRSVEKLLVVHEHEAYCQPCVSPIWDTGLACHALLEVGGERAVGAGPQRARLAGAEADPGCQRRLDRAAARSASRRLGVPICQSALSRCRRHRGGGDGHGPRAGLERAERLPPVDRAARGNGSWGCKAATAPGARSMPTTNIYYLNNIPFADHGALLDPPTEDVTARCVSMLAQIGETRRARRSRARSTICAAPRWRRAAGTAAGA